MRYIELGTTGLVVSQLGFGGIPIRRLSNQEAIDILHRAYDLGVTFYDTAKGYGDSEEKIGQAFAERRDKIILATKTPGRTKEEAAADIEQSLRRLRTDYIDLYQLHNVARDDVLQKVMGPGGAMEALRAAKEAGKIGHIGITSHSRDISLQALATGEFATLMIPFSYLEPEAGEKVLPACHEMNVAFICMKPFSGGALDTHVQCLKWVLGQGITVAIPGIGSIAELEEDMAVAGADWTLGAEDIALMERVKDQVDKTFCRRCDYCQPCTSDIPISAILSAPLLLSRQGIGHFSRDILERTEASVESCTECRTCESRCPYELKIPELLRQRSAQLRADLHALGWPG